MAPSMLIYARDSAKASLGGGGGGSRMRNGDREGRGKGPRDPQPGEGVGRGLQVEGRVGRRSPLVLGLLGGQWTNPDSACRIRFRAEHIASEDLGLERARQQTVGREGRSDLVRAGGALASRG